MRLIKFIDKFLNFIVIMFFIIVIAFTGYAFYDIQTVYNEAKLSDDILKYKPEQYEIFSTEKFNLADLQNEINEDICGWIRIDDTNIDYPILYPHTSLEYLDKDYKKNYTPGGSIFIDYKNDRDFKDDYTIIYGHNMTEKMMFSDIKNFKENDYFEKHKTGKLYTSDGIYNIKIYTFNILNSSTDIAYSVEEFKNGKNQNLISNFEKSAVYKNDIEINPNDKLVILTTCNGVGTPERAVLFCKLEKTEGIVNINEETDSAIDKDEKKKEQEKANKQQELESKKIIGELNRENYKNTKKDYNETLDALNYYFKRLLNDPMKLSLYILVIITVIIYIILIIKKIRKKKHKKNNKNYTKVELVNRGRIDKLRKNRQIVFKENSNVAKKILRYDDTKDLVEIVEARKNDKRKATRKGRHST